jgi:hypothetical protein
MFRTVFGHSLSIKTTPGSTIHYLYFMEEKTEDHPNFKVKQT